MKKLWRIFVLLGLLLLFMLPTAAMADNENAIYVDGQLIYSDTPTYLYQNYTYVPLRFISEALGADVSWEADTRTAVVFFSDNGLTVRAAIDDLYFYANGDRLVNNMGSPQIRNSRTFVPLRMIAEATGAMVSWEPGRIDIHSANFPSYTDSIHVTDSLYECIGLPESVLLDYVGMAPLDVMDADEGHLYSFDLGDAFGEEAFLYYQINEEGLISECWVPAAYVVYDQSFPYNTILTTDLTNLMANGEFLAIPGYLSEVGFSRYWSFSSFSNSNNLPIRVELSSESPVCTLTNTQVHYTYLW